MTEPTTRTESDRAVLSVLRRMRPDEMDVVISEQVDRLRSIAATAGLTVTGPSFGMFHTIWGRASYREPRKPADRRHVAAAASGEA